MTNIIKDIDQLYIARGWTIVKPISGFQKTPRIEDLAQYTKDQYIVDFGFYGDEAHHLGGDYSIYIISDNNWDEPIAKFSSRSPEFAVEVLVFLASFDLDVLNAVVDTRINS